jgi:hypothetical protein
MGAAVNSHAPAGALAIIHSYSQLMCITTARAAADKVGLKTQPRADMLS